MKINEKGQGRINLSFSLHDKKDNVIMRFLETKYSECGFIKEVLYALATGAAPTGYILNNGAVPLAAPQMELNNDSQDHEEIEEREPIIIDDDMKNLL